MSTFNSSRPVARQTASSDALTEALRDAAGWLQTAADAFGLQSLKDAAARAQSTLAGVRHG